jgi:hypothetical protein
VDPALLEDLCEEVEDEDELKVLLGTLLGKLREQQLLIIKAFASALGTLEVRTLQLDQHLSREAFIAFASRIDSLIDAETSDDVFSQLCGYPFEKVQKPMTLHTFAHAWVRLANLYSMFAAQDGNADFVDIIAHLDNLEEKMKSKGVDGGGGGGD